MAYSGKVFSAIHNWADDVVERLSWLTTVLPHRDASEQRYQPRLYPRRVLEYSVLAQTPALRARLDNFLWSSMDEAVVVPIWTDATRLTAAATSGTPTVTVSTTYLDYDASTSVSNYYVILWASPSSYEVVKVSSLNSTTLTLSENLVSTWPIGTIVAPAKLARIAQTVQGTQIAHDVRPYKVIFEIDESSPSVNRVTANSPSSYLGVDVFKPTNFGGATEASDDLDYSYDHPRSIIDAQTGVVAIDAGARAKPYVLIPYAQKFRSRQEVSEWFGFLDRRKGRRVPFWIPSWEKDFEPSLLSTGAITYSTNGYADFINASAGRRDLAMIYERDGIVFNQGDQINNRILSATNNGNGTETMSIHISGSVGAGEHSVVRLSLLRYCRMEADTAEIAWKTSCISTTRVSFRELAGLPT